MITLSPATAADAERLADIRVEAMRPSLEAVGLFDPQRARRRLLDDFSPGDTRLILAGDTLAGFCVIRLKPDHLRLQHLYLRPNQQGQGLGRAVLAMVKDLARGHALPIRLSTLKDSPSNGFYLRNGFRLAGAEGFDIHYHWHYHWQP